MADVWSDKQALCISLQHSRIRVLPQQRQARRLVSLCRGKVQMRMCVVDCCMSPVPAVTGARSLHLAESHKAPCWAQLIWDAEQATLLRSCMLCLSDGSEQKHALLSSLQQVCASAFCASGG